MRKVIAFNLSRLYKMLNDPEWNFGIISACRSENSKQENIQATYNLYNDLRALGAGLIKVKGGYIETDEAGNSVEVTETSFIVSGLTKKQLINLSKKYKQESILWKEKEFVGYIDANGNNVMEFKGGISVKEEAVKQYFTELKKGKRRFAFLSEMKPNTFPKAVQKKLNEYLEYIF